MDMAELVHKVLEKTKEWVRAENPRQIVDKPWRVYAMQCRSMDKRELSDDLSQSESES